MTTLADGSYRDRLLARVGEQGTIDALTESAARLEAVARRLGPGGLARPWGPGKWTGAQVLVHLADSEMAIGFRSRQVLTERDHRMQEYDEVAWMGLYGSPDGAGALEAFLAARRWNLALWRRLTPDELARVGVHPSRGEEAVETTLRALAGHTLSHLAQLEALLDG
jgi:hypothetical protein